MKNSKFHTFIAIAIIISSSFLNGCCSFVNHTDKYTERAGVYSGTKECAIMLSLPFAQTSSAEESIARAYASILFPLFLIDFPFEIVADTITFPYDMTKKIITK